MTTDEDKQAAYAAARAAYRYTPKATIEVTTAPEWCPRGGGELCCRGECGMACVKAADEWAMQKRRVNL